MRLFAQSLAPDDKVALEVTGNAWEIARILEPHVARVIVVSPGDTGIRQARAKIDRLDALAPAKLLAAGSLDTIRVPDERSGWRARSRRPRDDEQRALRGIGQRLRRLAEQVPRDAAPPGASRPARHRQGAC